MKSTLRFSKFLILLAALLTGTAALARTGEFADVDTPITRNATAGLYLGTDGIYKFLDPATLQTKVEYFNGVRTVDPEGAAISFSAGEPVAVRFLPNGDVRLTLLLADGETGIPESIVISGKEFDHSGLRFKDWGDVAKLKAQFSNQDEVLEVRRGGHGGGRSRVHSRGRGRMAGRDIFISASGGKYEGCMAWVCRANGKSFCEGRIGGGKGMVKFAVAKRGYRPLPFSSCSNPPLGTVASWVGGPNGSGHTGRWNGSGYCYDQGCGDPGSGYRMVSCAAPP